MSGVIAALEPYSYWARSNLLVIVLLVLGAALLTRLANWVRGWFMVRLDAQEADSADLVRSEAVKHRHVVAQVVTWGALAILYVVTAVLVIEDFGVPLASLVAPAALVSAALGFGSQRFIQDIGAGLFITGERQYGFGDVIRISVTGVPEAATGTVEEVTLRVTRIRSVSGEVITTPNGQIIQVTNLSRDWARAVIDIPVPSWIDVAHVTEILRGIGQDAYEDQALREMMLDPPTVMGVEGSRSTRSRSAWWRGRCPACSSTSAVSSARGSRPPSGLRGLSSRPSSTPAARPEARHDLAPP